MVMLDLLYQNSYEDLERMVVSLFNREPFTDQPACILHANCGNGIVLKNISEAVRKNSLRGKHLDRFPVTLIGVEPDETLLREAGKVLEGTDFFVINANGHKPTEWWSELTSKGITDRNSIVGIQTFPGFNRKFDYCSIHVNTTGKEEILFKSDGIHENGSFVAAGAVREDLAQQFKQWASFCGPHGLLLLEAHSPDLIITDKHSEGILPDSNVNKHLPVEAETFLVMAAEAGLFPMPGTCRSYAEDLSFSKITLNHLVNREYRVRHAQETDLPVLEALEKSCWDADLCSSADVLRKRVERYPEGQFVLEADGKVLGAVYSQRIADIEEVKSVSMTTVEQLHTREGSVIQLLALNVFPHVQNRNYGDQLLEFMLQRCMLVNGIRKVIGVTRCKDYHKYRHIPKPEYIHLRNERGRLVDTTLRLHESHGAVISQVLPGYRPADLKNLCYGVLVEYDIHHRVLNQSDAPDKVSDSVWTENTEPVREILSDTIRDLLGPATASSFSFEQPLMEMGLDSGDLLELNERIRALYNLRLEPAFFFEYNTAGKIISYLEKHLNAKDAESEKRAQKNDISPKKVTTGSEKVKYNPTPHGQVSDPEKAVAIVGMAFRFPGGINTREKLWEALEQGKDCTGKLPDDRWKWPFSIGPENDHRGIDRGAFLDNIEGFDPLFFRISPKEAQLLDPQQRILLEMSWECLEDAGYAPGSLAGSKTGVFIGVSGSDYGRLLDDRPDEIDVHFGIGASSAVIPNRISYFYDFHGPSLAIDTACSSSLVAVHEAVRSILAGESKQAFAGGINIICHPALSIAYYKAGMLSRDGKCKTFDKEANGYVRGEGAALILLKPLEDAVRDNDSVYAVIRGSAVNHGGQAGGLTVPNPSRQASLIQESYNNAGIDPCTISYIEAHGTGTSLGDPIEIKGLKEGFSKLLQPGQTFESGTCGLGSVKTNIGHLEAAAGIAGLIKIAVSMQHKVLPASLHFHQLNPHISFTDSPFYVVDKKQPWKISEGSPVRRAGVSSFGSGGTNAHVVLEEYVSREEMFVPQAIQSAAIVVLSAKNQATLRRQVEHLLEAVTGSGLHESNLRDLAYTLQVGRADMEERLAFITDSFKDLEGKLKKFLAGIKNGEGIFSGQVKGNGGKHDLFTEDEDLKTAVESWIVKRKYNRLVRFWVEGLPVDWSVLYGADKPRRIALPAYPFERENYWIPENKVSGMETGNVTMLPVHSDSMKENTPVAREIRFLQKQWKSSVFRQGNKPPGRVAIFTTKEMESLALQLSSHFASCQVIDAGSLSSCIAQPVEVWKEYSGCIDLTGCGIQNETSLGRIEWLQRLIGHGRKDRLMLLAVTKGLESYQNKSINLSGALQAGLYRLLQSEYKHVRSRHLDTDPSVDSESAMAALIASEYCMESEEAEVCFRNGNRYSSYLEETRFEKQNHPKTHFPSDKVLWITGGTRGLGYLCAEHFVKHYGVKKLVLAGREQLPPRSKWNIHSEQRTSAGKKIQAVRTLETLGAEVEVLSLDLKDREGLRKHFESISRSMGSPGGFIHAAGIADWDDPAFIRKSPGKIQEILDPKVQGLKNIYECIKNDRPEFLILFSSVSGIIPTLGTGQSDYAMANSYMDYFAESVADTCQVYSIQWPSWKEAGMGEITNQAYIQTGLLSHTNEEGLKLLDNILSSSKSTVILPAVVNPALFQAEQLMQRSLGFPEKVTEGKQTNTRQTVNTSGEMRNRIENWLTGLFSQELQIEASRLDADRPLQDYGADSILLAQLLRKLNQVLGEELAPSVLYEYPTIHTFSGMLAEQHASALDSYLEVGTGSREDIKTTDDLAAATLAWLCRLFSEELKIETDRLNPESTFPSYGVDSILLAQILRRINRLVPEALSPTILYEYPTMRSLAGMLADKYPSTLNDHFGLPAQASPADFSIRKEPQKSPVPETYAISVRSNNQLSADTSSTDIAVVGMSCRFGGASGLEEYWQLLKDGRSAIASVPSERWGYKTDHCAALVNNLWHADPDFFLIPREDAQAMDLQALVLLEEALKVWCHAGYTLEEIKGSSAGIYLGARSRHNPGEALLRDARNPIVAFGQNYLAANLSHFFDLNGPSLVTDTACSSALVAMNLAIQAIISNEVSAALVGGVSLLDTDAYHRIFQQRGILSPDQSFHIFDQRAHGVVLGEGVGMVLLRKLEDAVRDGNTIYGVIKGIAINNDGRTAGPATPNLKAQKEVMQRALEKSGLRPEEVGHIEGNGSGSMITDLLELKAIESVYRQHNKVPCSLGSVKPNIGHPLCAEGIAGFIKAVLMLSQQELVPFLSGNQPLKHYSVESSPFYFSRQSTEWIAPVRAAAVNCFADGGTNAHVVLEAWEEKNERNIVHRPLPLPVLNRIDLRTLHAGKESLRQEPDKEAVHTVVNRWKNYSQIMNEVHPIYASETNRWK
jgi:acyl transferase domain-containing protein/NAD(P)-dependent dehydrogenase (short-subunit alcohol dehydrogenase family)/acyl carrier protein